MKWRSTVSHVPRCNRHVGSTASRCRSASFVFGPDAIEVTPDRASIILESVDKGRGKAPDALRNRVLNAYLPHMFYGSIQWIKYPTVDSQLQQCDPDDVPAVFIWHTQGGGSKELDEATASTFPGGRRGKGAQQVKIDEKYSELWTGWESNPRPFACSSRC